MSEDYPTWTGRIPQDVKEYFQKKGYSAGQIFTEFYKYLKQQEIPELLQEKEEHLKRVRQIDQIVTQMKTDCKTKLGICNTSELDEICRQYLLNERPIENPASTDKNWIQARLKKNKIHVDVQTFLERCREIQQESGV